MDFECFVKENIQKSEVNPKNRFWKMSYLVQVLFYMLEALRGPSLWAIFEVLRGPYTYHSNNKKYANGNLSSVECGRAAVQ